LIEKFLPTDTKRRVIAMVMFRTITERRTVFKLANITNLKKFLYRLGSVERTSLEKEEEMQISESSKVNEESQGVEKFSQPYPIFWKAG
jgi:hypothetical protein